MKSEEVARTRERDAAMSVTVLGMGGTIDKDYPRSQMGYAFEIDEPAAQRILEGLPHSGIEFDVVSICKKDSTVCTVRPHLAQDYVLV